MSAFFESIPPDRKVAYLQNTQEIIEAATQPVINSATEALGELVIKGVESLAGADAKGAQVADEAQDFLASDSIGDQADEYLGEQERQIEKFVDEVTGEESCDFTSMRSEYVQKYSPDRADLGRLGFGNLETPMDQSSPLQNQLWVIMTEQNRPGPENPQAPSS
ncbi:MAG TPA: hypothetical protein VLH38_01580 [Patescibacteria group bacterium]|nr:hypothetical protein [Patescibacteria group bacterium]